MSFTYADNVNAARIADDQRRVTRTITITIVIIVVLIIIAIIVYIIIQARNNNLLAASSSVPPSSITTPCNSNAQCPSSSPICNTSKGVCVQCNDNSTCSGTKPVCETASQSCVQCLASTDCGCGTCSGNLCVVFPGPVITSVVVDGSNTTSMTVNFTYSETGAGIMAIARLLAGPNNTILFTSTAMAVSGSPPNGSIVLLYSSFPTIPIFSSTVYSMQVQIIQGTCSTAFGTPFPFTTPNPVSTFIVSPVLMQANVMNITDFFFTNVPFLEFGIIADPTINTHPNLTKFIARHFITTSTGGNPSGSNAVITVPWAPTTTVQSGDVWHIRTFFDSTGIAIGQPDGDSAIVVS